MPDVPDSSTAPGWFVDAVATVPEDRYVEVEGAQIHYLFWGEPDRPGLLFVHGGAAHAHWWSHIAPAFLADYSVAALDLSGAGDSDRRDSYDLSQWGREVVAVAADADFAGTPVIVGHSMGGFVSIVTAANHCDDISGVIILDSPVTEPDPEVQEGQHGKSFRNPKTYDDIEDAVARFRTIPAQDHYEPYVMDNVARNSLRQLDNGSWTWKFDPGVFSGMSRRYEAAELLSRVDCRLVLFRSEHGLVTESIGAYMYEQLGRVAPVIELPTAGHHPMLDVPLLVITGIRTVLADWEHSWPIGRRSN